MTRRIDAIDKIFPCAYVEIFPGDAESMGIHNEDAVRVSSRRGASQMKALFSDRSSNGVLFMPVPFQEAAANVLTNGKIDPVSEIPEFRACTVRIKPVKNNNFLN